MRVNVLHFSHVNLKVFGNYTALTFFHEIGNTLKFRAKNFRTKKLEVFHQISEDKGISV